MTRTSRILENPPIKSTGHSGLEIPSTRDTPKTLHTFFREKNLRKIEVFGMIVSIR